MPRLTAATPKSAKASTGLTQPVQLLIGIVLLIAITLSAFLPALNNQFIDFDDDLYVTSNPHVHEGVNWTSISWAFHSTQINNWHPVTWLSHCLDWQLFGNNPWGHHLVSVLVHTINGVLLMLALYLMTRAPWRSFFVAALFAVHPLRVESVAWIAERKDLLSTFFGLSAIIAYVRYQAQASTNPTLLPPRKNPRAFRAATFYILSLAFFILSLMSKPMLVTLPFVLLLLDYWPLKRIASGSASTHRVPRWLSDKIPFLLAAIASSYITFITQRSGGAMRSLESLTFFQRATNALVSYGRYLLNEIWPNNLSVFYPHPGNWPLAIVLCVLLPLIAITGLALYSRKAWPFLLVGWLWYLGTLTPVLGLIQVGRQAMADRYTYFPIIGIALAIVWGLCALLEARHQSPQWLALTGSITIVFLALATRHQVAYWKNSETLLNHAIEVTQGNYLAYNNLGTALQRQNRTDEAAAAFRQAIKFYPADAEAHVNLGNALCRKGQVDEGIKEFGTAIQLRPDSVQAHHNLGLAFLNRGHFDEGIKELETTTKLRPDVASAHFELARALAYLGRKEEAIREAQEALRLKPDQREPRQLLDALRGSSQR